MLRYSVQRFVFVCRSMATTDKHSLYQLCPLKLGAEVTGISLQKNPPQAVIDQIRRDVHDNCILVFRDQGILSGKRQVQSCIFTVNLLIEAGSRVLAGPLILAGGLSKFYK